ncbi:hypothetical protein PQ610_02005 [Tardisphaera miroshnichenkoae]
MEPKPSLESWLKVVITRTREAYTSTPQGIIRKLPYGLGELDSPCQVFAVSLRWPKKQYIYFFKDSNRSDLELLIREDVPLDELILAVEKALSDQRFAIKLDVPALLPESYMYRGVAVPMPHETLADFIRRQFASIIKQLQSLVFIKQPPTPYPGIQIYSYWPFPGGQTKGWLWYVDGHLEEIDPEYRILDWAVEATKKNLQNDAGQVSAVAQNIQTSLPPAPIKGYGTFIYPPVWIGDLPKMDLMTMVWGVFVPPRPMFSFRYGNRVVAFGQHGLMLIEAKERREAIQQINEIFGAALLLNHELDAVRESDLGEATFSFNSSQSDPKVMVNSLTFPASLPRLKLAQEEFFSVSSDALETSKKLSVDDLKRIIEKANSLSNRSDVSDYVASLAKAHTHLRYAEYEEAFIISWRIIEKIIKEILEEQLKRSSPKEAIDRLKRRGMEVIIEVMNVIGGLYEGDYGNLMQLKSIRNKMIHGDYDINGNEASKCYEMAFALVLRQIQSLQRR